MTRLLLPLLAAVLLAGCEPEPRPIRYGEDACAHCRMTVSDARFGAELVTATGKTLAFDSIECLAEFFQTHTDGAADVHSVWVTAYDVPETLMPAEAAAFLQSPGLRSPMGAGLAAFRDRLTAEQARAEYGGELLDWAGAVAHVQAERPTPHTTPHTHAAAH